jgi:hypothetical protein
MSGATVESRQEVALRFLRELAAYLMAEASIAQQLSQQSDERAIAQLMSVQAISASYQRQAEDYLRDWRWEDAARRRNGGANL